MLKRFITAMLGSLAAIWISVILLFILGILFIGVVISKSVTSQTVALTFKNNTILHIELNGAISERATNDDIFETLTGAAEESIPLNDLINAITAAADDEKIEGIFVECKGSTAGLAQRLELNNALEEFKKSGKWIVAYGDSYSQSDYYTATSANEIYLNPVGIVDVHGLSATTLFYKGFLEKVGVEMQIIKVGTYKSAVEPYILDHASEASKLQQEVFLNNIWNTLGNSIANARGVSFETVNEWADSMLLTYSPAEYLEAKVVDKLVYRHEVLDMLKDKTGVEKDEDLRFITPGDYVTVAEIPHAKRTKKRIAVLYAVGSIVDDGRGGIVATKLVPEILKLKENDKIDGLILRVNSGGGSAFASEQIWEALEQFKSTNRPFYVSMSDYAASGGYYISSGADVIYAEPVTLTGSIGIFGMIPCVKELMNDKLGLTTDNVSTNANGDFPSVMEPMTAFQRERMQHEIDRGYETFVSRCAQGRHLSVDSIKAIAEGRVWDGTSALKIGLVDKLGSLSDAIHDMAQELGISDKYCIVEYPDPTPNFLEAIMGTEVSIKDKLMKESLGSSYNVFKEIEYIKNASEIQCKMEYIEIQ